MQSSEVIIICNLMFSLLGFFLYICKHIFYFLKDIIYLFLERGEGRDRNINVWLPLLRPLLGACVLTGNPTGNPLLHRAALYPLSHASQGQPYTLNIYLILCSSSECESFHLITCNVHSSMWGYVLHSKKYSILTLKPD